MAQGKIKKVADHPATWITIVGGIFTLAQSYFGGDKVTNNNGVERRQLKQVNETIQMYDDLNSEKFSNVNKRIDGTQDIIAEAVKEWQDAIDRFDSKLDRACAKIDKLTDKVEELTAEKTIINENLTIK